MINVFRKIFRALLRFFPFIFLLLTSFHNIYVFVKLFDVILLDTFYDFRPDLECFSKFDGVSSEKWSYSQQDDYSKIYVNAYIALIKPFLKYVDLCLLRRFTTNVSC